LQGASDVETISEPEVVTVNGRQTELRATQSVPVDGTNADVGASLDMTPYFSTNSLTFNLDLGAKLTQLTGDPSQPGVQTIEAINQVTLSPDQIFVFVRTDYQSRLAPRFNEHSGRAEKPIGICNTNSCRRGR
jgi:hypothetical protein